MRCTYPQLQDHPSVAKHPPVLGLAPGRRLVFIDHRHPELQEEQQKDGMWKARAGDDQPSKVRRCCWKGVWVQGQYGV